MKALYLSYLLIPLIVGCTHTGHKPGFPRQSYHEADTIKQLEAHFPITLVDDYYSTNNNDRQKFSIRNKIVDGRLALIDLNYNQFVAQFSLTRESLNFGADMAELGLNLATTAVGGAAAKTTLGAISAGVTGGKVAVDKNFFFEKTAPVLVGSMNAQRKTALIPILIGVTNSVQDYPLTRALADLDNYYQAGTFVGALQTIQADAGVKEHKATEEIKIIASYTRKYTEDIESAANIRSWVWPNGFEQSPNADNLKALKDEIKSLYPTNTPKTEVFLTDDKYKADHKAVIEKLKIPKSK